MHIHTYHSSYMYIYMFYVAMYVYIYDVLCLFDIVAMSIVDSKHFYSTFIPIVSWVPALDTYIQ